MTSKTHTTSNNKTNDPYDFKKDESMTSKNPNITSTRNEPMTSKNNQTRLQQTQNDDFKEIKHGFEQNRTPLSLHSLSLSRCPPSRPFSPLRSLAPRPLDSAWTWARGLKGANPSRCKEVRSEGLQSSQWRVRGVQLSNKFRESGWQRPLGSAIITSP